MKDLFLATIVLLSLSIIKAGDVVELTDANFKETLEQNPVVLVKFFAPWCGHCKKFAPEFERLATMVKDQGLGYVVGEVNTQDNRQTASSNGIRGIPTVKLFISGKVIDYKGERKAESLIQFVNENTQPLMKKLATKEEFQSIIDGKGFRAIFVGNNEKEFNMFNEAKSELPDYEFYKADNEEVAKEVFPQIDSIPAIVVLKEFDEKQAIYQGQFEKSEIIQTLKDHMTQALDEFEEATVYKIFRDRQKKGVIFFRKQETSSKLDPEFTAMARAKKNDEYVFIIINGGTDWEQKLTNFLGIQESDYPSMEVIIQGENMNRYKYTGEMKKDNLIKFFDEVQEGKAEKYVKSEDVPEENPGPVYKLVGKNFDKDVINNDLDIFVKIYAPWCGHCRALATPYAELAEELKNNEKLKFYEFDGTKNDIPVKIEGYPTVLLFKGNDKKNPASYEDYPRTKPSLLKFLKENCANPINAPDQTEG